MGSVPDYRGLFLRGFGGNSSSLGSTQGDAIRNITGNLGTQQFSAWNVAGGGNYGDNRNVFYYTTTKTAGADNLFPDGMSSFPTNHSLSNHPFASSNFNNGWDQALTKYRYQLVGDKDSGYFLQEYTESPNLVFFAEHRYVCMDISTQVPTANENRPANTAVRYMIKAR